MSIGIASESGLMPGIRHLHRNPGVHPVRDSGLHLEYNEFDLNIN
jgi:hypothetical protein